MGGAHREGHDRRRAGGERGRLLRARGRRDGRRGCAHHQHAASLRDHPPDPGVRRAQRRDSGDPRLLYLRVSAPGAEIRAHGNLRDQRPHRGMGARRGYPQWESSNELFADDLDRIAPWLERAIERMPIFGEVGIRRVINGAIPHTPDGAPLLGPAAGSQELLDVLRHLLRHRAGRRLRQVPRAVDGAWAIRRST
jgi:glycine/D-amino acid oxidase-like deaminating enzyme